MRIVLLAMLAACSRNDAPVPSSGECPPLEIVIDGHALPAMPHGLALASRVGDRVTYEVHVFDRDGATCEQLLALQPHASPTARAFAGASRGVGIDAWTQGAGGIGVVGANPQRAGDRMTICVRDAVEFTPGLGAYANRRVSIRGAFTGTYCGERVR